MRIGNKSTMDKKLFAERLKEQRLAKGYTQKALAELIGVTERNYQSYESLIELTFPSVEALLSISKTLILSMDYLFGTSTDPKIY